MMPITVIKVPKQGNVKKYFRWSSCIKATERASRVSESKKNARPGQ